MTFKRSEVSAPFRSVPCRPGCNIEGGIVDLDAAEMAFMKAQRLPVDEEGVSACELLMWSTPRVVLNSGVSLGIHWAATACCTRPSARA